MMGTHLNTVPTLSKTEGENNTEMVGMSNCSNVSGRTRPYYSRRCKMNKMLKPTNIESLPDDLIFHILVRVPAQDIYDAAKLVCQKWYKIIYTRDFIHAHLRQSTCGLLTRNLGNFIASGKGLFDISKLNYQFKGYVYSSCNGLVLEAYNRDSVCVTNPATKQNFALPPFLNISLSCGYGIAYAATSKKYKVVHPFFRNGINGITIQSQDEDCIAIWTVGVDKEWVCRVNTKHLSLAAKQLFFFERAFTTEGFVHWAPDYSRSEYVVTMNIETEIITEFHAPISLRCLGGETQVTYLPMGSNLSLLILRSKFSWEFWEMKPETGEWTKMPSMIDLESEFFNARNNNLKPVGWLRPREVLVFGVCKGRSRFVHTRVCFAFNVHTQELEEFKLDGKANGFSFLVHRNSLVWMDGLGD